MARSTKTRSGGDDVALADQRPDAGAQIAQAVNEALERGDCDEASRLAAGHPDPRAHVQLMERIHAVRSGGAGAVPVSSAAAQEAGTQAEPAPDLVMFALDRKAALLKSFNPRAEKHGAENKPAADIAFEANLAPDVLDAFDYYLRRLLFCKVGRRLDLIDDIHDAPDLRFSRLGLPVKWTARYAGYTLRVHPAIVTDDPSRDIVLHDCDLNNITLAPQQGGTVIVGWRVQCHPDEVAAGRLAMLVQARVDVTLIPPEGGGELLDDDDGIE